jgi:hypothetical protein
LPVLLECITVDLSLQTVALVAAVSTTAACELAAAATTEHPYCLSLWQQRQQLAQAAACDPARAAVLQQLVQDAQQLGLRLVAEQP